MRASAVCACTILSFKRVQECSSHICVCEDGLVHVAVWTQPMMVGVWGRGLMVGGWVGSERTGTTCPNFNCVTLRLPL